jgi:hypothetical protein
VDPVAAEIVAAAAALSGGDLYILSEVALPHTEPQPAAAAATAAVGGVCGDGVGPGQVCREAAGGGEGTDAAHDDAGYVPSDDPVDELQPAAATAADGDAAREPAPAADNGALAGNGTAEGSKAGCSEQQQQQQDDDVDILQGRVAVGLPDLATVEVQVCTFVASVLEPLLRAGVVSGVLADKVVDKACEKIMQRHEGSTDGSFLVREYTSITKLVTALVDHYQKRGVV